MITNFFIPELNNHDVQELWFQQDGATCHTAHATIDLLKDTFGDRLISRFGPVNLPPRSCDLTPLDYFCGAIQLALEHHAGDSTFSTRFNPNLERENPVGGQGPPTSPTSTNYTRGLAARRLFRVPPCRKRHCTFTNILVFSGIRTQSLRHRSQRL
ncbi:uncharacterized protein TNCV_569371 [Trichonephila clavipes]|nr:uncharacterized protein TNCV_569371 [Trichonephila clavipes]